MPVEIKLHVEKGGKKIRTNGSFTSFDDIKKVIQACQDICFACPLSGPCHSRPRLGGGMTVITTGTKVGTRECHLKQRTIILR